MASMENPYVYDKAKYHSESIELAGLPDGQEFVHTGLYLAWLVNTDLLSSEFLDDHARDEVLQVKSRKLTGPQLFMKWDGVLADDMLNTEGNAFSRNYFDFEVGFYLTDYVKAFNVDGGGHEIFSVEDTWDNYDKIVRYIDKAFDAWKRQQG